MDSLLRRYSDILVEVVQLSPEVVVRDERTAHIAAEAYRDIVFDAGLCALDYAFEDYSAVLLRHIGGMALFESELGIRYRRRQGADVCSLSVLEELYNLIRELCPVLYSVHAVLERHSYSFGALNMSRYFESELMSLIACRLHYLRRHLESSRHALFIGVHYAASDHQLDEIWLCIRYLTHQFSGFLRRAHSRRDRAREVSARDGYSRVGRYDARTFQLAFIYEVSDLRVKIQHAADCPYGGDSAHHFCFGISCHHLFCRCSYRLVAGEQLVQLSVVLRLAVCLRRLATEGKMHVQVYKAREQISSFQINYLIALQIFQFGCYPHYAVAVCQHRLACDRLHVLAAVQDHSVHKCVFHSLIPFARPAA